MKKRKEYFVIGEGEEIFVEKEAHLSRFDYKSDALEVVKKHLIEYSAYENLQKENAELKHEIIELKEDLGFRKSQLKKYGNTARNFVSKIRTYKKENEALKDKLAKAKEGLEFYANRNSWELPSFSSDCKEVIKSCDLCCESNGTEYMTSSGGRLARKTLAELGE